MGVSSEIESHFSVSAISSSSQAYTSDFPSYPVTTSTFSSSQPVAQNQNTVPVSVATSISNPAPVSNIVTQTPVNSNPATTSFVETNAPQSQDTSTSEETGKNATTSSSGILVLTTTWLPTVIIAETKTPSDASAEATSTSLATALLPRAIMPTNVVNENPDFELVTIGFTEALNYAFVVQHSLSSAQIFEYLPLVLANAFPEVSTKHIVVKSLVPYQSVQVDYMITVAEVYFDKEYIDELQDAVTNRTSLIYSNPDKTISSLAELIDPKIPVDGLLSSLNAVQSVGSSDSNNRASGENSREENIAASLGSLDSDAISASTTPASKKVGGIRRFFIIFFSVLGACLLYGAIVIYFFRRKMMKHRLPEDNDWSDNDFSSSEDKFISKEFKDLNYSGSLGDVRLNRSESSLNTSQNHSSISNILGFIKKQESPRSIPEISAPVNVKSSLGW